MIKKIAIQLVAVSIAALAFSVPSQATDYSGKKIEIYTTAKDTTLRLEHVETLQLGPAGQPIEGQPWIFVDPTKQFQPVLGIGGAFTDAAAETFAKLPQEQQQEVLTAYYDQNKGIGYTLGRTHINSCDFSSESYSYVAENDSALETFSIEHDLEYRIPLIKDAIKTAGGQLTLFVSPWSPPAWMKTNNSMLNGGELLPKYRQSWANYFVKFIDAYADLGVPIWGLTVQNEPDARTVWESCIFTANEQLDFVKNYLGPTMERAGLGDKKICIWDHSRDIIYQWSSVILNDPEAAKYVWGVGYHWYENAQTGPKMYDNVARVHEAYPDKHLLFTEGCAYDFHADQISDWWVGEIYGSAMINDFNSGAEGWTDWNILLNEKGGPNHVGNYCFAPIMADIQTGQLTYLNAYYYIGQFSKFVRPGDKRIISSSSNSKLLTTAFTNKEGKLAIIVMNTSDSKIDYRVWVEGEAASTTSLPHSISTLVIE